MRVGSGGPAVEAADRALPIAERLNLDPVVAEAFVNKGSALNILGRRREAIALQTAALDMAKALGDRNFEMRVRNNLASAIGDDDPAGATRMLVEALELARQIGDRGMFNWLAGTAAAGLYQEGRDWDSHAAVTQEALDSATLRPDRIRLRLLHGLHESARGERLDALRSEVTALVGDSTDPDDLFSLHMVIAQHVTHGWRYGHRLRRSVQGKPASNSESGTCARARADSGDLVTQPRARACHRT